MSFTYSGDPSASEAEAVRFEVPDTEADGHLLEDAEIAYALSEESSVLAAAARCCEVLGRRFAQQADVATGDLRVTYSKQCEAQAERAQELRARSMLGSGAPFAGGVSRADKESRACDSDREQGSFRRNQFDAPGT